MEDKPNGAGAVTEDDLFVNPAGKLIAPGAFIDTEVTGLDNDLFIRGREPFPPFLPPIQGGGSLPPEPHENGSEDHGVQSL